ncbi:Sodium/hydrogen exchanger family-domain-containing protein [Obelidium mucronatum]|nr:Sodium/hydrogen exchanger family-domain-containing protein [Obelidium mucronatum]
MVESGTILSGANPLTISPIALFLLQNCLIIATTRLLTFPLKWLRQPPVIAEVVGGLLLGASCLSRIPAFKDNVFPKSSMPMIKLVADIGLVFYLFLVGLELNVLELLKDYKKSASISIAGIILPFALGCSIANLIYVNYADQSVPYLSFLLFMGISMSITAFPVLARILTERKLLHTPVGQATISAAAVDDFVAWSLLVLVIALINNSKGEAGPSTYLSALYVVLCIIAYGLFLWFAIRPLLRRLLAASVDRESIHQLLLFFVFFLVLISGWFTEVVGVKAIFGAFMVGVIMPHDHGFAIKLVHQIEDLVRIVFLPLFFAYSGLNTRLELLDDGLSWAFVLLVCVIACVGKIVGCTLSARYAGLNWRESSAVGVLMNTRGLVEIIVLNIGLNAGVITPKIFAMFVLMAIFTTLLTVPLISVVYPYSYYSAKTDADGIDDEATANGLIPANDSNLRALVVLPAMNAVTPTMTLSTILSGSKHLSSFTVFALRLVKMDERLTSVLKFADSNTKEDPVLHIFQTLSALHGYTSHPLLQFSENRDITETIVDAAKQSTANLILIPQVAVKSTPESSSWLGDDVTQTTRHLAQKVSKALDASAAVIHFIDRGFLTPVESSETALSVFKGKGTTAAVSSTAAVVAPVSIVLVLGGGHQDASEAEAIRFVQHLSSSENVASSVTFNVHIIRINNNTSSQNNISGGVSTKSLDLTSGAGSVKAESKLGIKNAIEVEIDNTSIQAVTTQIASIVSSHKDLVVVGDGLLKEAEDHFLVEGGAGGGSHKQTVGLESWLEYESAASIAIVHGHK